jgi:hypothetical protein
MLSIEFIKGLCIPPAYSLPKLSVVRQLTSPSCYSGLSSKKFTLAEKNIMDAGEGWWRVYLGRT